MAIVTHQVSQDLMTVEQYALLPDQDSLTELVRGKVITLTPPGRAHGIICVQIVLLIGNYVKPLRLGRVLSNDSEVVTSRSPGSVRGADVAYYSYARTSEQQLVDKNFDAIPDLVFEVKSPSDRWANLLDKVAEYLQAGVTVVCAVDPEPRTVHVYRADQPVQVLNNDQEFTLPDLFPDFHVLVSEFFE